MGVSLVSAVPKHTERKAEQLQSGWMIEHCHSIIVSKRLMTPYHNYEVNTVALIGNAVLLMGAKLPRQFCKVLETRSISLHFCLPISQYLLHYQNSIPLEFWNLEGLWE